MTERSRTGSGLYLASALSGASIVAGVWLSRHLGPDGGAIRVAAALLPLPFLVWLISTILRYARELDELERRLHLDALVIAAGGTTVLTLVIGSLQHAGLLGRWSWDGVWLVLIACYLVGFAIAARRYR